MPSKRAVILTDTAIRSSDVMVNKSVKLSPRLIDWFREEALRNQTTVSAEIRRQLELAYKYREAIANAESAPIRFVKDIRR